MLVLHMIYQSLEILDSDIPSEDSDKESEMQHVKDVLRNNNYPGHFISKCVRAVSRNINENAGTPTIPDTNNDIKQRAIVLPYIQGVSERIGRILKQYDMKTAYKPISKIGNFFPRPKSKTDATSTTGIVYKIKCLECAFIYYGQTDRSLKTRLKEHKRNIVNNEPTSKIAQHANQTGHELDFGNTSIVDKEQDFSKRLFLEAWRSECDIDSKNYRINLPDIYKTLIRAHVNS